MYFFTVFVSELTAVCVKKKTFALFLLQITTDFPVILFKLNTVD